MPFHLFPTDADFDELHPHVQRLLRARKERSMRRGPVGRFFRLLVQILVFSIFAICIIADFKSSPTIAKGFQRPFTSSFVILAFAVGTYHLFMWRLERWTLRRLRRHGRNIKTWLQSENFDRPEPPVTSEPELHFDGDSSRN